MKYLASLILLLTGPAWATPDPVYEYEAVLHDYLVAQRCSLDNAGVNAGFADASLHFAAGEFVSGDGAAAMRASVTSQIQREWGALTPEQRWQACETRGRRYAERLRDLLYQDTP